MSDWRPKMAIPTPHWVPDTELGDRFVQTTMLFQPDYDGQVTATLVRNEPLLRYATGAVIYLHGFIDDFFQRHLADAFNAASYNFYALDLRKYGRSLDTAKHPNSARTSRNIFRRSPRPSTSSPPSNSSAPSS
jgi:alpha-beta hydrolase superfamily lysophospholipase